MSFLARVTYTANGTTDTFQVPFPYIETSHIKVSVNDVAKTLATHYNVVVAGAQTNVVFTAGNTPSNGQFVQIRRETSQSQRYVLYNDGYVLTQKDLNNDSLQAFYLCQESLDKFQNTLQFTYDNKLDAGGREITNVGAPTANSSAVTKGYMDTYVTGGAVTAAAASAAAAASSASSASSSASAASASASSAASSASAASSSASSASSSASSASSSASSAAAALASMDQGSSFGTSASQRLYTGLAGYSGKGLLIQSMKRYSPDTELNNSTYDYTLATPLEAALYGIAVTPWNDQAVDFKVTHLQFSTSGWLAVNTLTDVNFPTLSVSDTLTGVRLKKTCPSALSSWFSINIFGR